ncbi:hypothetical protein ACH5RR_039189 [Cinchona calisaya]|uniref:Uncharacterized protein n=1 Tax=Cinchona calisaya TaxID=153742 RepID=A0ABD2Y012_9GENT
MSKKGIESSETKSIPVVVQSEGVFNAGIILNESNYDVWSQFMEMHIAEREKLSYIRYKMKQPVESEDGYEKRYAENQKVKRWLLMSMTLEIMKRYLRLPTAHKIWSALSKAFYDGSDELQVFALNQKAFTSKQSRKPSEWWDHSRASRKGNSKKTPTVAIAKTNIGDDAVEKGSALVATTNVCGEYQKGIQTLDYDIVTYDYDQSDAKIDTEKGDINDMTLDLDSHLEAEEVPESQDPQFLAGSSTFGKNHLGASGAEVVKKKGCMHDGIDLSFIPSANDHQQPIEQDEGDNGIQENMLVITQIQAQGILVKPPTLEVISNGFEVLIVPDEVAQLMTTVDVEVTTALTSPKGKEIAIQG